MARFGLQLMTMRRTISKCSVMRCLVVQTSLQMWSGKRRIHRVTQLVSSRKITITYWFIPRFRHGFHHGFRAQKQPTRFTPIPTMIRVGFGFLEIRMQTSHIPKGNTQWWGQQGEASHHRLDAIGVCPRSAYENLMLMGEFGGVQKATLGRASNDT